MSGGWTRTCDPVTNRIDWTKPGFIISKESGYPQFTLRTTPGDSWPINCLSLRDAKETAELPTEFLREKQRAIYLHYHRYWSKLVGQNIDDRILKDAIEEDARRSQRRQAA